MDLIIFRTLNSLAGHSGLLDHILIFCAAYLQYVIAIGFVVFALSPQRRIRIAVLALISAGVARGVIKTIIVFFWHRPRPFVDHTLLHQLVQQDQSEWLASFPSGHAIFFFALAMAIYMHDRRFGKWFFAGATLMGLARVAVGIHWPSDIVAGAILGMLTAWAIVRYEKRDRHSPIPASITA